MQSVEQLENMGIDKANAQRMLDSYAKKIGYTKGDYVVTDITYMGDKTRDIEMTCSKCGRKYHKEFVNGRNNWSEMKSICPCESEKRHELGRMFNTSDMALRYRIKVKGMTVEQAVETPKMCNGRPRKEVSVL